MIFGFLVHRKKNIVRSRGVPRRFEKQTKNQIEADVPRLCGVMVADRGSRENRYSIGIVSRNIKRAVLVPVGKLFTAVVLTYAASGCVVIKRELDEFSKTTSKRNTFLLNSFRQSK